MDRLTTEVLIHITAPGKATDDVNYRTLAQAYLDFETTGRIDIDTAQPREIGTSSQRLITTSSPRPLESPRLSFRSVWDNLASPNLKQTGQPGPSEDGDDVWVAPPSTVGDSQPNNDITIAAYCTPTRILEHYLQRSILSPVSPSDSRKGLSGKHTQHFDTSIELGEGLVNVGSLSVGKSSVLSPRSNVSSPHSPASNSGSELVDVGDRDGEGSTARKRQLPSDDAEHELFPATSSSSAVPIIATSQRAESEPPPRKKIRSRGRENDIQPLARSNSDVGPQSEQATSKTGTAGGTATDLEITAPDPPVSCDEMSSSSLITPKLSKLMSDLTMKRLNPMAQSREVRPFERGYWLVDTSTWDATTENISWMFLATYIPRGDAGWGVSCRRDELRTWLRVYSFGKIYSHMYLVLYLASKGEIYKSGAAWHGGDGEAIIRVHSRRGSG